MNTIAPFITLVVPVWNVEHYLPQCLDSIINQTLKNIEIICINDGSPDSCETILNHYAERDGRIKVISQQNAGQGHARNVGVQQARGKYVFFVDSDDWLELTAMEKLYQLAEKNQTDIVICNPVCFDENLGENVETPKTLSNKQLKNLPDVFSFQDAKHLYFDKIPGIPWNKLYRTQWLKENNIYFQTNIKYEDYPYFYEMFVHVKRASFLDEALYVYRLNRAGSDATDIGRKGFTFFEHYQTIEKTLRQNNLFEELKYPFLNKKITGLAFWIDKTQRDLRPEFIEKIQQEFRSMNLSRADKRALSLQARNTYFTYALYPIERALWEIGRRLFSVSYESETHIFRFRGLFFIKFKMRLQ